MININLDVLKTYLETDDEIVIEKMIRIFCNEISEAIDLFNNAPKIREIDIIRQCAHKLKSSSAYFGANELNARLLDIESLENNETDENLTTLIKETLQLLEVIKIELEHEIETFNSNR